MFQELSLFLFNTIYYFWSTINHLTVRNKNNVFLFCSQYISLCAGRENLFNNQEVLQFIIIAFILVTLMFDSGVILKRGN